MNYWKIVTWSSYFRFNVMTTISGVAPMRIGMVPPNPAVV